MKHIINQCINNWQFDLAENFYNSWAKTDENGKKEYIDFLYNTAQIDKLLYFLKDIELIEYWDKNKFGDFLYFKDLLSRVDNEQYVQSFPQEIILSHSLLKKLSNLSLGAKEALDSFKKIRSFDNSLLNKFLCAKLIDYFCVLDLDKKVEFFIPTWYHDEIFSFATFLYSNLKTDNMKSYLKKYNNEVKNILRLYDCKKEKKIAICLYGVLRGNWQENLNYIIDTMAKPLKADCFLFSWDEYQQWCGLMGGIEWALRCFKASIGKEVPPEINYNADFARLLPRTYYKMQNEYSYKISKKDMSLLNKNFLKKIKLEKQENVFFEHQHCKLYYGMYKSFSVMREYEKENYLKYDYVIVIRSDVNPCAINYNDLVNLEIDEISDAVVWIGSGSGCIAGTRSAVKKYVQVYNDLDSIKSNKFYTDYANNHEVLYKYPLISGLNIVSQLVSHDIYYTKALAGIRIPNFDKELSEDCELLKGKINDEIINRIIAFFDLLKENYKYVDQGARVTNKLFRISAVARIKNQLSYKLGQAMVENSTSLFGYIKMPFILFYIKAKHTKEKEIYKKRLQEHPSSRLPILESYADYQEALKEKESLEYRLGQILMHSYKTWYKGGLFKLWFEINKLNKEFKSKKLI
ncbi:hypothetical protein [Campylobacter estrildidarum]|uniref:Capsular biosynthesis protein n=1 Tax=Campylobacter estrildidarum TaxID=2510189 RepID=A0A4U7BK66_9BACT|nr:hypothetical protein [Campylobacter estrildidarum]TKX30605.1 hypothetical protein CQA69_05990 [Campylobacter estrildidarum]